MYDFSAPVTSSLTLYAKWNINQNIISFESNGGSYIASQTVNPGGTVNRPTDPTRGGYNFEFWYSDPGLTAPYNFSAPVTGSFILYAKWTPATVTHTVDFESNGGTHVASQAVNPGSTASRPANPTLEGYTFENWYSDPGLTILYNFAAPVTSPIIIYAKWTLNRYVITFDADGGFPAPESPAAGDYGSALAQPPAMTKTGYTFDKWYTDSTRVFPAVFPLTVSGNVNLYAKWNPITYTVRYDKNAPDAGGSTADSVHTYDAEKSLNPNGYTRTIYTFTNWNSESNGSGTNYSNSQNVKNLASAAGDVVILYAIWDLSQYTVSFASNGGSTVAPQTITYGLTASPPADPTRSNYTFGGWYSDDDLTVLYNFDSPVEANITLYARWIFSMTSDAEILTYLAGQSGGTTVDNPVLLPVNMQLTDTNWLAILSAIDSAGKYVALDLSTCSRSYNDTTGGLYPNGRFDPMYTTSTGKSRIVSIILPDEALSMGGGVSSTSAFSNFNNLKAASGKNITNAGFKDCTSLTSIDFPLVTNIGSFEGCTSLTSVNFPLVTSIGQFAFRNCTSLTSVNFPLVANILSYSFEGCTSLTSVDFPLATNPGDSHQAIFYGCTSLQEVSLPLVTKIEHSTFWECTSLSKVYLPLVTSIGDMAFVSTGSTPLTITLGAAAPKVGTSTFSGCPTKNVTVLIPPGAKGYGSSPTDNISSNWGNAFRGWGWDGTNYLTGNITTNIKLTIQTYQP